MSAVDAKQLDAGAAWRTRIQVVAIPPHIVEMVLTGKLEANDTAYIKELSRLLDGQSTTTGLLFQGATISGFSPMFAKGHIEFFKLIRNRIKKVAAVHNLPAASFAIASVGLASGMNIKSFETRAAALAWLNEP